MQSVERIRQVFERNATAMKLRPSVGKGTAITRVRMTDGFSCDIVDGAWHLKRDMAEKSGGNNTGPNPGVYGRTALGTCLAMTYVMWFAKLGVPLDALEVEVQADYDSRGYHGVDGVPPGYDEVRYLVQVQSSAPDADVMHAIDEADAHCDFLAVFAKPQRVLREVKLNASGR